MRARAQKLTWAELEKKLPWTKSRQKRVAPVRHVLKLMGKSDRNCGRWVERRESKHGWAANRDYWRAPRTTGKKGGMFDSGNDNCW